MSTAKRIPQSFIRDVIARSDIVEIVQARMTLQKKGKNYSARCPFHEEKTPSFTVSQDKQFYYCFGCGAHGTALDFLMQYDRLEFLDAIKTLAASAGLDVPQIESYTPDRSYDALFPVLDSARQFYCQQLRRHPNAITYLKSRGITGKTAKTFALGFAPPGWDNLLKTCQGDAKRRSHLATTGMIIERDAQSVYDRFRARIMFPIQDLRGRTIAFGGRTLGDEQPKYLNSPETPLFHKTNELYGLYQARQANQQLTRLIIVEGYMDVISLHEQGITNAVATLGTAVNVKHLQKCLRFTSNIVFCLDGDNAGRHAAWKALTMSMPQLRDGIEIRFLFLPDKEDPDSLVKRIGKTAFEALLDGADTLQQVFFDTLKKQHPLTSLAAKASLAADAKQHITAMPEGIYKTLLYDELAAVINVDKGELAQMHAPPPAYRETEKRPIRQSKKTRLTPVEYSIALLLQNPELAANITDTNFLQDCQSDHHRLLLQLLHIFTKHPTLPVGQLMTHWQYPEEQARIAELAAKDIPIPEEGRQSEFKDSIHHLRQQANQAKIQRLIQKARQETLDAEERTTLNALLQTKTD